MTLFFFVFFFSYFLSLSAFFESNNQICYLHYGLEIIPSILAFFVSVFTRRTSWLKEKMVVGAISILPTVFCFILFSMEVDII